MAITWLFQADVVIRLGSAVVKATDVIRRVGWSRDATVRRGLSRRVPSNFESPHNLKHAHIDSTLGDWQGLSGSPDLTKSRVD